jgi:hypothetical protein
MRTLRCIVTSILILIGLLILLADLEAIFRWGCDINDAAVIDPQIGPIDWPTGERPGWALIPAFIYSVGFWVVAALLYVPWPATGRPYRGRVLHGAE